MGPDSVSSMSGVQVSVSVMQHVCILQGANSTDVSFISGARWRIEGESPAPAPNPNGSRWRMEGDPMESHNRPLTDEEENWNLNMMVQAPCL